MSQNLFFYQYRVQVRNLYRVIGYFFTQNFDLLLKKAKAVAKTLFKCFVGNIVTILYFLK